MSQTTPINEERILAKCRCQVMRIATSSAAALVTFSVLLPILPIATFYAIYYGALDGKDSCTHTS